MVYRRRIRDKAPGREAIFVDSVVLSPNDIVAFFCETLKIADEVGATRGVRKAKRQLRREGMKTLRSWEKVFGQGFFDSCAEPLSLITTGVRWDNDLNQFVVLSFIDYICSLMPGYNEASLAEFPAKQFRLSDFWETEGEDFFLYWYGLYAGNPREDSYPYMTISGKKGLAFKIDINYPNITLSRKRNKEVMQKKRGWLMRYESMQGSAVLNRVPEFYVRNQFPEIAEVEPSAEDLLGTPAKFSWLELGEAVKTLVESCVFLAAELQAMDSQDMADRYSQAWGQVDSPIYPGLTYARDVHDSLTRTKVLFDVACLYAGKCCQFALPVGFSQGVDRSLSSEDRIFITDEASFFASNHQLQQALDDVDSEDQGGWS